MEEGKFKEVWDKKKIFVGLTVFAILLSGAIYTAKIAVLSTPQDAFTGFVKGTKTSTDNQDDFKPQIPDQSLISAPASQAQKKIDEIRQEVSQLDIAEIASSSPQIQKVLKDIQSLEQYPRNQAKELCENLCKSL